MKFREDGMPEKCFAIRSSRVLTSSEIGKIFRKYYKTANGVRKPIYNHSQEYLGCSYYWIDSTNTVGYGVWLPKCIDCIDDVYTLAEFKRLIAFRSIKLPPHAAMFLKP